MNPHFVLMVGGQGKRFWPHSTRQKPKQFLPLLGKETLFRQTLERIKRLSKNSQIWAVVTQEQAPSLQQQLDGGDPSPWQSSGTSAQDDSCHSDGGARRIRVLVEPVGRNTAACLVYAALSLSQEFGDEACMVSLPSDHYVEEGKGWETAMTLALEAAKKFDLLMTLGIKPKGAEEGYGYIDLADSIIPGVHRVKRFVEKPSKEVAERLIQQGAVWNSGIFVWTIKRFLETCREYIPHVVNSLAEGLAKNSLDEAYRRLPDVSIDYALMERAQNVGVVPADFDWDDLGSWSAVARREKLQRSENTIEIDAQHCYVNAPAHKTIALVGVENLIVVDTPDKLLICHKDHAQQVKKVVEELEENKDDRKSS